MQALSLDRCKSAAGVADAIERRENRLMLIQEGDASFVCGEGWQVSLLRKIPPEVLDKEVALRSAELGDSYDKTRAFVMKYAAQESIHSNTDMDASELSWNYNGGGYYSGIEELDYSEAYYDEQNPWGYPAVGYDGFELNTVAFGNAKG